jgi:hypothetical protein
MTQDRLAKEAGVTRHTILALEAGKHSPYREGIRGRGAGTRPALKFEHPNFHLSSGNPKENGA